MFMFKAYTNKEIYLLGITFTFPSHLWSESWSLLKVLQCFTGSGERCSTWAATQGICRVTECSLPPAKHWPGSPQCTSTWSSLWLTQFRARKRRHFPISLWHARCSSAGLPQSSLELVISDYLFPWCFHLGKSFPGPVPSGECSPWGRDCRRTWTQAVSLKFLILTEKLPLLRYFTAAHRCTKGFSQLLLDLCQLSKSEWKWE